MLQAVATLAFLFAGAAALFLIGRLLSRDWDSVSAALGLQRAATVPALPPRYRTLPARRAALLRSVTSERRAAA